MTAELAVLRFFALVLLGIGGSSALMFAIVWWIAGIAPWDFVGRRG